MGVKHKRIEIQTNRGKYIFTETGKKVPKEWLNDFEVCMENKKGWIKVPVELCNSYITGWK